MGVPTYTIPTANSDTATEEPKIITALTEIKSILNGNVDENNIASGAAISGSQLETLTAGYIYVANASGVITGVAMSGDATIDSTGALSLANGVVDTAELVDDAVTSDKVSLSTEMDADTGTLTSGTYQTLSSISCTAGTWLIIARATFVGNGSGSLQVKGHNGLANVDETTFLVENAATYHWSTGYVFSPGSTLNFTIQALEASAANPDYATRLVGVKIG